MHPKFMTHRVLLTLLSLASYIVLDSHPVICATDVLICERPQHIVAYTDPFFEFSIAFEVVNNVPLSAKTTFQWRLCAQNKKRVEQFASSLSRQLEMSERSGLRISRTVDSISPILLSAEIARPKKKTVTSPGKSSSIKPSGGSSNKLSPVQPSGVHMLCYVASYKHVIVALLYLGRCSDSILSYSIIVM